MKRLAFSIALGSLAFAMHAGAGEADRSASYGPLDSQSGSLVDATPGTKRAEQRSPCERLKGKAKAACLKKKPLELSGASRRDASRGGSSH